MAGFSVVGYDVDELLGFGSCGEVWSARGRATGRPVALRRLRLPSGAARREQLRAEASQLMSVAHPHLVPIHGVVTTDDSLVLVLDLVGGGTLTRLLERRGPLSAGEVVTLLVPLAQALDAAHDRGVVHGRVTTSAVLLDAEGRPLLSDLGLAALARPSAVPSTGPSEASAGLGPVDPADDVHGLAAMCWTALVGHPPYDAAGNPPYDAAGDPPYDAAGDPPYDAAGDPPYDAAGHPPYDPSGARLDVGEARLDPAGERITAALLPALSPDRAHRPAAGALAEQVYAAARAEPLRLGGGQPPSAPFPEAPGSDPPRRAAHATDASFRPGSSETDAAPQMRRVSSHRAPARSRPSVGWRGWASALLGVAALVMAALSGLAWAGSDAGSPAADLHPGSRSTVSPRAASPSPALSELTPSEWGAVLRRLDGLRSDAFATASPARLRAVYAVRSPAFARDRAQLAELVAAGVRATGLRLRTTEVSARRSTPSRVTLRVVDELDGYAVCDLDGTVVARRPGRGAKTWSVTLVREGGEWRVYDVVAS